MIPTPSILGPNGQPVSAERVKLEKLSRFNPLMNWTPDVLTRQLAAYWRGEISALCWVMEWLEKHDDIISCVAPKAKAAVSRWGYDVLPKDEIRPDQQQQAEDQQGVMQAFFQNLQTSDALELEEQGGMRLLFQQIMDAYGKGYAAHHIIWKPTRAALNAELVKVPSWFFEVTTGRMKFLTAPYQQRGVDLETLGGRESWLISKGRGVMLAGAMCRMFKQIPLQDWLTYCDRHGMPAFLGKTNAAQGTSGWNDMVAAVGSIGSEFGAVINQGDVIEVLTLAAQGEVPYEKLIDRMDRAQVMLWRGGDLSTISRDNGVGSNPQQEDAAELDADNSSWVSETINRGLTDRVIAYRFGRFAPVLVEIRLRTKTRDNLVQDLAIVQAATEMGVRISKRWFTNKFGVVVADPDEEALGTSASITSPTTAKLATPTQMDATGTTAVNAADPLLQGLRSAIAEDMQPLGDALYKAVQLGDDAAFRGALKKISARMPDFLESSALAKLLATQNTQAFSGGVK